MDCLPFWELHSDFNMCVHKHMHVHLYMCMCTHVYNK